MRDQARDGLRGHDVGERLMAAPKELTSDVVNTPIRKRVTDLDHAGGAGAMMRAFPNVRLVVHPRGARHMIDPSRLMQGTIGVYGAEATRRLYGEVLPVDAKRVTEAPHGMRILLAGRELLCLDTPGHARHHIAIVDRRSGHIFSGDTFGISYRQTDTDGRQFIFLTATPVQFDPEPMHASIDLLASYRPEAVYLTHFSQIRDVAAKVPALQLQQRQII